MQITVSKLDHRSIEARSITPSAVVRITIRNSTGRFREGITLHPADAVHFAEALLHVGGKMDALAERQRVLAGPPFANHAPAPLCGQHATPTEPEHQTSPVPGSYGHGQT